MRARYQKVFVVPFVLSFTAKIDTMCVLTQFQRAAVVTAALCNYVFTR